MNREKHRNSSCGIRCVKITTNYENYIYGLCVKKKGHFNPGRILTETSQFIFVFNILRDLFTVQRYYFMQKGLLYFNFLWVCNNCNECVQIIILQDPVC